MIDFLYDGTEDELQDEVNSMYEMERASGAGVKDQGYGNPGPAYTP